MSDTSLPHHEFDDCLWIRCANRGSFINSPTLKSLAEAYLAKGGINIVVDLEVCPGVDSTFMGTLAALSRKVLAVGGHAMVASPTQRTRAAMESLGLDMLMEIDPPAPFWQDDVEQRRAQLETVTEGDTEESEPMSELERTRHVLDAHNTLRSMNTKNDQTFGYVCETLEEDLQRHSQVDDK
ncbi:MAG: STAS domain-containing protein [Akkermansia sp.]|nr:STAS domain-containing protein [Akkermansia sp.]